MSNTPAERIVWIDCEMTGLDVERDRLCEIAVIITDFSLTPVHPGLSLVINPGEEALERMSDFVRNMHVTSGLLEQIPDGLSVDEAETAMIAYIQKFIPEGRRPLVAGNTIGMDRRFISTYMPTLDAALHYRSIDVSTIKELARRWYPETFHRAPEKTGGHRALADIAESIQELAFFQNTTMVPQPGPDATTISQVAKETTDRFASFLQETR